VPIDQLDDTVGALKLHLMYPGREAAYPASNQKGQIMLEGFGKRDVSRSQNAQLETAYSKLNQALGTATPAEAAKPAPPRSEAPKAQEPAKPSQAGDKVVCKLTVGPDIKLKGAEITDCDTLVVEGRVEASMDSRVIQIAERGVFVGRVGIDVAEIRGQFEGELTAHKQLVIHASGRVSGTIRYGTISIEEGGELSGDVAAIASTKATATGTAANQDRKPAPNPAATPASRALTGDSRNAAGDNPISVQR
jgi:cytoskeletal protein CcmA (bactofilin family)